MSGVLLLHKKVSIMENNETKKKERVYKLKFDQLWIDAINQIPVYYHSEIYYWLDYYQNLLLSAKLYISESNFLKGRSWAYF